MKSTYTKDRIVAIALAIIAVVYSALLSLPGREGIDPRSSHNTLDRFQLYGNRLQAGHWFGYLWIPYNERRQIWSRILLAIDIGRVGRGGTGFCHIWTVAVLRYGCCGLLGNTKTANAWLL